LDQQAARIACGGRHPRPPRRVRPGTAAPIGLAVLMVRHANKKGLQRGRRRREDMLDQVG
jgi:hypothetical protein